MLFISVFLSIAVAAPYCSLESSDNNKKTIETIQTNIVSPFNLFCADLKNIVNNKEPQHHPVCSAIWEKGQAWWKKMAEEKPAELNKHSDEYKNPSRNEMLAHGFSIALPSELKKIEAKFNALKARTVPQCCGNDVECSKAYLATSLKFCSDPKAEADPNAPDPCADAKEAYFNADRKAKLGAWFLKTSNELPQFRLELLAKVRKEFPQFEEEMIRPGFVTLSKYKSNESNSNTYADRHELGHACNFIRRQIASKSGTKDSLVSWETDDYDKIYCKPQSGVHYNFTFIDTLFPGKSAVDLKICIQDRIKSETQDPKDYAYFPDSCIGSKIEEAMADAFASLTANPDELAELTSTLCMNAVSAIHFSGYSTFDCFIKNVPGFADKISRGISCPK
ncbi:MAG: hypothetical protein ACXVCP_06685 [Bdellovibrio sp.]